MNITFTGPHCSGKTTLLKQMKADEMYKGFYYIDEVTRLVKREFHVNINEEGANDITQLLIINKELENLFKYDKEILGSGCKGVVHDRCLLDGLVYTEFFYDQKLISQQVWSQAIFYWNRFHTKYDIILYPDPHEINLQADGERSTNIEFRNAIIDKYENYYLNQFQWKNRVHKLKGTIEERMDQIKLIINEHTTR